MRISRNWLNDYVLLGSRSNEDIAKTLTNLGFEVEAVESISPLKGDVVVGEILAAEKHPNADSLKLCKVDVGRGEALEIVCGAPNARAGLKACVALDGAVLPGDFKIKRSKIRGVTSNGMMCAEDELGLSSNHDTIIEVDASVLIGTSVASLFKLEDTVFEVNVTPNRPDCFGVIGIARELAAKWNIDFTPPHSKEKLPRPTSASRVKLAIESLDDCMRFVALELNGVEVIPSPLWLQRRLEAQGMRPINLVVDVTNYVMLEYGQPIHAYDARDVSDYKLGVRRARNGETITTLDGHDHDLLANDLVIYDDKRLLGIAGVMGGRDSEVKADTTSIIIEVAGFHPSLVRKTSKRLGLHTEASHRFERGIDLSVLPDVCYRVADLIYQGMLEQKRDRAAALKIAGGLVEAGSTRAERSPIALRLSRSRQILGLPNLNQKTIESTLKSLGLTLMDKSAQEERSLWQIPSWRHDLLREIDLIEEVARVTGFEKIPFSLPTMQIGATPARPIIAFTENLRTAFASMGFVETILFPFLSKRDLNQCLISEDHPLHKTCVLKNPIAADEALLRTSLIPTLIKATRANHDLGQRGMRLFEVSRSYHLPDEVILADSYLSHISTQGAHISLRAQKDPRVIERNILAALIDQPFFDKPWAQESSPNANLFHAKGLIEQLSHSLGLPRLDFCSEGVEQLPFLHPKLSLLMFSGATFVGFAGMLHPKVCMNFGFETSTAPLLLELLVDPLLHLTGVEKTYQVESFKFPPVARDLSLILSKDKPYALLEKALKQFPKRRNLSHFELFDVFEGEQIGPTNASYAFALRFQSMKRTLSDKDVDDEMQLLLGWLKESCGAALR